MDVYTAYQIVINAPCTDTLHKGGIENEATGVYSQLLDVLFES